MNKGFLNEGMRLSIRDIRGLSLFEPSEVRFTSAKPGFIILLLLLITLFLLSIMTLGM